VPDLWVDVDTAVTVPVNIFPLTDDTDFKAIEASVAYNAAGMSLNWNFQTTAGGTTCVAVTPTTGGAYDWATTLAASGMYEIEIPASGGATINNDTEGVGWFTGVATGVLPWRGPTIGFRAAALNNALVDGATIDVNVTAMAAGVVTATVIADDAIDAGSLATGAFTADAFAADALVAAAFATDCITDDAIATGAIASTAFAAGAITAAAVADGAIDAATFAAGAIDAAAIADNAIDAGAIAADAITAAKIAAGAIDNATFAADVGSTAYATNVIALAADKAITNAALATAAALDTVDNYLDTELAAITAAVITNAAGTDIAADIIALKTVADTIQADTDLLDDAAGGIADIHTDLGTLATAVADLPTNSELATALASADDAVLTAVDAVPTAAEIKTAIEAAGSSLASILADTAMIEKWIIDKMVATDNGDGTITYVLYDTDGTTPLYTWVETTATGTRAAAT